MLLRTKLLAPQPHTGAVRRASLLERLDQSAHSPLTLISAPAGFGKTSLLSTWVHEGHAPVAWYSLDPDDDEPTRFWTYLVEALRTVVPTTGEAALQLIRGPGLPDGRSVATIIANDMAETPERVSCVLDDLHVIQDPAIHAGVEFLISHSPPNLGLLVTTRSDPPWELARHRAQQRMSELRAIDLRFTEEESRGLLETAGLRLPSSEVQQIKDRTEGWAAGLQMAALSMRGRDDVESFIEDFTGSHRFVLDYLTQEVLARQSDEVRRFLAQTSILSRLRGDLCDAVTGDSDGARMLEALEQANLFTDALDDERLWYRYHQLFADVLRSRLAVTEPEAITGLHARAAAWLDAHGFIEEAIDHALEANDVDHAVVLLSASASATFSAGDQLRLLGLLDRLPQEAIDEAPVLALQRTWARFVLGFMADIDDSIAVTRSAIASVPDEDERSRLEADLDATRAWIAYQSGDLPGCIAQARQSLTRMPEGGLVSSQLVAFALGAALLLVGDLDEARTELEGVRAGSRRADDRITESLALALIGRVELLQGRLSLAKAAFELAIEVGTVAGAALPPVGIAQVQLGEVLRELDMLRDAEAVLRSGIGICERSMGVPEWVYEGRITLARVLRARGRDGAASDAADTAERFLQATIVPGGMEPLVGRGLEYRLRYLLDSGTLSQTEPASPSGSLAARMLLVQGKPDAALELAAETLEDPYAAGGPVSAVESRLVSAMALAELSRADEAVEQLSVAVEVAEPDGITRLFLDFGPAIEGMLRDVATRDRGTAPYAQRLLVALRDGGPSASDGIETSDDGLIEPLNGRETELLELLAARRSNQEIADEMFISVNTVKWHARNLYGKLGVSGRAEAVVRGRELGLI